jgi:hypothetical protein
VRHANRLPVVAAVITTASLMAVLPMLGLAAQPNRNGERASLPVVISGSSSSGGAKDCGEYADTRGPAISADSKAALDCFYQAFQQCNPTILTSFQLFEFIIRANFSLQGAPGGCSVAVEVLGLQRAVPEGQTRTEFNEAGSCTQLSRDDGGGLILSGCAGITGFSLPVPYCRSCSGS